MQLSHISGDDLAKYLPHRGRNLLLDEVDKSTTPEGGPQAEISLRIGQPDRRKRELFLEKDRDGKLCYSPYMFAEFLALGSIVLLTDLPPGTMAYFSTITNYECRENVPAAAALRGVTIRNKDRALFKRFSGKILGGGDAPAAETDIMAFAFNPTADAGREEKKISEKPAPQQKKIILKQSFTWKDPAMVFADELVALDLKKPSAMVAYTYPETHPFTEGHFPGNPVMMGITLWMGCADAVTWLTHEIAQASGSPLQGSPSWSAVADVEAVRPDGTVACEVRAVKLGFRAAPKGIVPQPQLISTARVGFRDIVRPKETLYFRILNYQIQN